MLKIYERAGKENEVHIFTGLSKMIIRKNDKGQAHELHYPESLLELAFSWSSFLAAQYLCMP